MKKYQRAILLAKKFGQKSYRGSKMISFFGKILILFGFFFILLGILFLLFGKIPFFGKLPGDILIKKENFTFYFPLASCILISILLSLIFYLISKFSK